MLIGRLSLIKPDIELRKNYGMIGMSIKSGEWLRLSGSLVAHILLIRR